MAVLEPHLLQVIIVSFAEPQQPQRTEMLHIET